LIVKKERNVLVINEISKVCSHIARGTIRPNLNNFKVVTTSGFVE